MTIKTQIYGAYLDTKDDSAPLPLTGIDVQAMCGEVGLFSDNDWGDMREWGPGIWLYLTPAQARELGAQLVREARAASGHDEQTCRVCIQNARYHAAEARRAAQQAPTDEPH
jgi:hypothetical protein